MPPKDAAPKDCTATALNILSLRDHTEYELARKLQLRGFDEDDIALAVAQCKSWNYLNDERAAEVLAKTLLRKGAGKHKIRQELKKRRIDEDFAGAILQKLEITENQAELALAVLHKRFDREKAETAEEIYRQKGKMYRYLQNKGYAGEDIYRAFDLFFG